MPHSSVRLGWRVVFLVAGLLAFSGMAMADHPERSLPGDQGKIMQFQSGGHILGFDSDKVYMVGLGYALIEEFVGASKVVPVSGAKTTTGSSADGKGAGAPAFQGVTYPELWKGVTLRYDRASDGLAESVYVMRPGANVSNIRVRYNVDFAVEDDGTLRFSHPAKKGYFTLSRPLAWQEIGGRRVPVAVAFKDHGHRTLGFALGAWDPAHDLIIDPTYQWHTFYGSGSWDGGNAIAVTGDGVYVAGYSDATWQGDEGQNPKHAHSGNADIAILKLSLEGVYQWHTFYGATNIDIGKGIAVTGDGVYVTGISFATWQGDEGQNPKHAFSGDFDIAILKLTLAGAYQWHTFYGSANDDRGYGIAVTGDEIYVTGQSGASWQGDEGQNPKHAFSGGSGYYQDIFILKLSLAGAYQWHTFYGSESWDSGDGIAVTGDGVYVTGQSGASWQGDEGQNPKHAFSGTPGNYSDIVILKLSLVGAYQWHTFYGSAIWDAGNGIAVTGDGVYVTGMSDDTWQGDEGQNPKHAYSGDSDNQSDIVVLKLSLAGAYEWHTFYGSAYSDLGRGIAVTGYGLYVTGNSYGSWLGDEGQNPKHPYSGDYDIVILKLSLAGAYRWHTFYGSADYEEGHGDNGLGISVTGDGVYVTGESYATWQGDGGQNPKHDFSGSADIAVLMLSDSPPSVTTQAATSVDASSATLNGLVNANGESTSVTFEYGLTTAYGTTVTADQSPVTGSTDTAVSKAISGLSPDTTYHFRAVGVNSGGTSNGEDLTFTTLATYTLTTAVNPAAVGTVTKNPDQATYTYGTSVQLTATANAGYTFIAWSGDLTGTTNPASITMNGNKTVTANFLFTRYVCSDGLCGTNMPCHKTIAEAVAAAGTGTLIKIAAEEQSGSFSLEVDKDLILQGGWDKTFNDPNGGTTTLKGAPKAPQGSLTFQNLRIVP